MIPLADCEDRRLYRLRSRNLTIGAFNAHTDWLNTDADRS